MGEMAAKNPDAAQMHEQVRKESRFGTLAKVWTGEGTGSCKELESESPYRKTRLKTSKIGSSDTSGDQ